MDIERIERIKKPQRIQIGKDLIEDDDLDKYVLFLYAVLFVYADKDTRECYPSLETLAKETKSSKSTVIKRLSILKERGNIDILNRGRRGNLYTLTKPPKLLRDKEEFTMEFMHREDLTIDEKIFFICTSTKSVKNTLTGIGEIKNFSVNMIAKLCGKSWGSANKIITGLRNKNLIEVDKDLRIDYTKISQAVLFMAVQVQENTEDIVIIKNENTKIKEELRVMGERIRFLEESAQYRQL